jgi:hypothetical protein
MFEMIARKASEYIALLARYRVLAGTGQSFLGAEN